MSSLVEPKLTWKKDILNHNDETRSWKAARGLVQDGHCRVCQGRDETIEHLLLDARSWQTARTC